VSPEYPRWKEDMQAILRQVEDNGNVLVTTVTAAYLDFFENWRCSLQYQEPPLAVKYVVFSNDLKTHEYMGSKGIPSVLNPALLAVRTNGSQETAGNLEDMRFGSEIYQRLMGQRTEFLLTVLQEGYNVLTFDVDAVWEKNPIRYLDQRGDMVVVQEHPYSRLTHAGEFGLEICGCFLYLVNTPVTRSIMTETVRLFYNPKFSFNEQKVIGFLLQNREGTPWEGIKLRFLPKPEFPNGREYYGYPLEHVLPYNQETKEQVVVLHNNWVKGHSTKKQRWMKDGHWYLAGGTANAAKTDPGYSCRRTTI